MFADKKILFVTSVNLSANPRCLKEIRSLYARGANITVAKFVFNNWSNEYEAAIERDLPGVTWLRINATRKPLINWVIAALVCYSCKLLQKVFTNNLRSFAYSLDKRIYLLDKQLRKLHPAFDFVIAHNPVAFYPAYRFASKHKIALGIDVEDYHPGENDEAREDILRLMKSTLPDAAYLSAASPLILSHTIQNLGMHKRTAVINNVFSLKEQQPFRELELEAGGVLKLFWFSQHVDVDRGIENAIDAMNSIDDFPVRFTLMGNCADNIKDLFTQRLVNNKHQIVFMPAAPQQVLIAEATNHHIGLALENSPNLNRTLCLTNKLFTYLLAGNAIIASDTPAQHQFIATYPEAGVLYNQNDAKGLSQKLSDLYANKQDLALRRQYCYRLSLNTLNWEAEEHIFLDLLKDTLV